MSTPPPEARRRADDVVTEEQLRVALVAMMRVRSNLRATAADTGLSKTTIAELRRGRRRASLDSLTKIVSAYAPDEVGAWRQAWHRVNQGASVAGDAPGPAPERRAPELPAPGQASGNQPWWRLRPDLRLVAAVVGLVAVVEAVLLAIRRRWGGRSS